MTEPLELLPINAFGLIRATNRKVYVNITTVVNGGRAINRAFSQEVDGGIPEIEPDESPTAIFGIQIDATDKWMVVINEIVPLKNLCSLGDLKPIGTALTQAVTMIKNASNRNT